MPDQPQPESAAEALQKAVIDFLKADETLKQRLDGKIFDEIPADNERPRPPYAYVGAVNFNRVSAGDCASAWAVRMRLFVCGVEFGRLKVWALVQRMIDVLDLKDDLQLDGPYSLVDRITCTSAGDVIEPAEPKEAYVDISTDIQRSN
jgi:hypothetical protein